MYVHYHVYVMRVLTLLSGKGGTGKSTLAVHLAAAAAAEGVRAAVLDTDPQGSSYRWLKRRGGETVGAMETDSKRFPARVEEFRGQGIDLLVIDTPGHCGEGPTHAASLADLVLIPSRPGQLDLETVSQPLQALMRVGDDPVNYFIILSLARVSREGVFGRDDQAVEQLEALGYRCGKTFGAPTIHDRVSFEDSAKMGMTAAEYEPDGKAALEMHLLWRWVASQLKVKINTKRAA